MSGVKLPQISGKDLGRVLERLGFLLKSQRGSHMKFVKENKIIIVPDHKLLKKGTLKSIIKQADLDNSRLKDLL